MNNKEKQEKFSLETVKTHYSIPIPGNNLRMEVIKLLIGNLKKGKLTGLYDTVLKVQEHKEGSILSIREINKDIIKQMEYISFIPFFKISNELFTQEGKHSIKVIDLDICLTFDRQNWTPPSANTKEAEMLSLLKNILQKIEERNKRILPLYLMELYKDNIYFVTKYFLNYTVYLKPAFPDASCKIRKEDLFMDFNISRFRNIDQFIKESTYEEACIKEKNLTVISRNLKLEFQNTSSKEIYESVSLFTTMDKNTITFHPKGSDRVLSITGFPAVKLKHISIKQIDNFLSGYYLDYYLENIENKMDAQANDTVLYLNLFSPIMGTSVIFSRIQEELYQSFFFPTGEKKDSQNKKMLESLYNEVTPADLDILKEFREGIKHDIRNYLKFSKLVEILKKKQHKTRYQVLLFKNLYNLLRANGFFSPEKYISYDKNEHIQKNFERLLKKKLYVHFYRDLINDLISMTHEDQGVVEHVVKQTTIFKSRSIFFYINRGPEFLRYKNFRNLARQVSMKNFEIINEGENPYMDLAIIPFRNIRSIYYYLVKEKYSNEWKVLEKFFYALQKDINITGKEEIIEDIRISIKKIKPEVYDITINNQNPNIQNIDKIKEYLPSTFKSFGKLKLTESIMNKTAFGFKNEKEFIKMTKIIQRKKSNIDQLDRLAQKEKKSKNPIIKRLLKFLNINQKRRLLKNMDKISGEAAREFEAPDDIDNTRPLPKAKSSGQQTNIYLFLYEWLVLKAKYRCSAILSLSKNVLNKDINNKQNIFCVSITQPGEKYVVEYLDNIKKEIIEKLYKERLIELKDKEIHIINEKKFAAVCEKLKE